MNTTKKIAIAGTAGTIVGSLLPWATITAPFIGRLTITGTDGDGVLFIFAAAALALAIWKRFGAAWLNVLTAVAGLGLAGYGVWKVSEVDALAADAGDTAIVSVGMGLYVLVAAGIALIVAGVKATTDRKSLEDREDLEEIAVVA